MHNLGYVYANLGRLDAAKEVEQRAVDAFARQADPRLEGASRVYLARILLAAGDVEGAEREARAAFAATANHGASKVGASAALARALLAKGDLAGAREAARDTEALLSQPAIEEWEGYARITVVEVLDAAGEHAPARTALERALAVVALRASRLRDPAMIASLLGRIPEHARTLALAASWGIELPEPLRRDPAA
jgi:ATP/maltotriose-dependent transcriptional regulator MalT